eukprot:COSAG05_NODE_19_length_34900_cov_72.237464_16_plen_82_part_00
MVFLVQSVRVKYLYKNHEKTPSKTQANGVCMDDELTIDAARDDSERNLSLAFVDDKHARVAYDDVKWSKASAEAYINTGCT